MKAATTVVPTTIKIHNTMTRAKQVFTPLQTGEVKMYVCGPTVYDYIHIGNARPLVFFDVVRRYFEQQKFKVNYIVNFTDVDDKLIRKAEQLGCTVPEVAERFIAAFYEDIESLGVQRATANPRVTEHMPAIIAFIADLMNKGFAYENAGDVYFCTARFPEYGKLSQQKLDDLQFGIRIEVDERKQDPADFVLWKAAKPGEIYWSSPWGDGRPGWHIECSALVKTYLGETIDIHGGGHDLTFPHHECEIAQSEAHSGHPLANYWMHNGYIHIDNEKMSKSLGNSILVRDLMKQLDTATIRYFILSTHYRNPLNFTEDSLRQARGSSERIRTCHHNLQHRLDACRQIGNHQASEQLLADDQLAHDLQRIEANFFAKMSDDFNTADAFTAWFEWVSVSNSYTRRSEVNIADLERLMQTFAIFNEVLGLFGESEETLLDADIERLIVERAEARAAKNWARADEIRNLLTERGIILEDTPQGMRWRRS